MENIEITNTERSGEYVSVSVIFGEDCKADYQLSMRFIREYVKEWALNVVVGTDGFETVFDLETFITEDLDFIIKHILEENA